jgi:hypothetical protein
MSKFDRVELGAGITVREAEDRETAQGGIDKQVRVVVIRSVRRR